MDIVSITVLDSITIYSESATSYRLRLVHGLALTGYGHPRFVGYGDSTFYLVV